MYETDSDNDAPEDVTFQQAKEVSKSLKRNQVSNERVQKLKKREMNKAREDALKEQKAAKKAKLDALRLPDDVLEAIDDKAKEEDNGLTGPSHLLTDQSANRVKFDSDDEGDQDDVDSGISTTVTSKISVREVNAIKSKAFQAAMEFRSIKQAGWNSNIKRQSAKERQLIKEKKMLTRR